MNATDYDDSAGVAWEQENRERAQFSNQKAYIEKLQQAEQDKGRKRMSEWLNVNLNKRLPNLKRKRQQMEQKAQATKQQLSLKIHISSWYVIHQAD